MMRLMEIVLHNVKPKYMSESEVSDSDIYMKPQVVFEAGKKYMVCARSGHGKTSLLNFIYGVSSLFDGEIELRLDKETVLLSGGRPIGERKLQLLRKNQLSYLFQELCLFPELTAIENVELKNGLTGHKSGSEMESMLDSLLPAGKKSQPVGTLSLGQRQRVAAVRALCQPFGFLMLDEPFSHIDRQNSELLAEMVMKEVEGNGAGLIVTALDAIDLFDFDQVLYL